MLKYLGVAIAAATSLGLAGSAGASPYKMIDLGALPGGVDSTAFGINDAHQVVGQSDTTGSFSHAFLYSGGTMSDLGTLGGDYSTAKGINKTGQIAGSSSTAGGE